MTGRRFGRYVLLEAIDRGGMAEVYRAVSHGPGGFQRQFVIKRIRKEKAASKDFVDMFINEARISALLEHPNIVQVYDFGQVEGDYFLAMEYLRGRNLLTVGRRVRSLTHEVAPDMAAYVGREVARGLHYAHTLTNAGKPLGIVHRDVSPSNVMLLRTGGVKLLDFGIARATMKLRANTPIGGLIKGKLSYLSPEQVRGQGVDGRSDVFSLGVVLWEVLTGVRLFYNPNELETMRNVLHRQIPRPSELRLGLPAEMDHIVMRALERNVEKRYPDAAAMANELEEYLRECRFSPEQLVKLLEELYADEDSARELPLPDESSIDMQSIREKSQPGPTPGSLGPPPVPKGEAADGDHGYATVSSVRRLSDLAGRHRRRRIATVAAGGAMLAGLMVFGAITIPGRVAGDKTATRTTSSARVAGTAAAGRRVLAPTPPSPTAAGRRGAGAGDGSNGSVGRTVPARVAARPAAPPPVRPAERAASGNGHGNGADGEDDDRGNGRTLQMSVDPARGRKALARGLAAVSSGEYQRAVQELEIATAALPSSHEALRALAEAEFELARYPRALTHARKAASLAPRDARTRSLLGDAYFKLRRYREAAEAYGVAANLAPRDSSLRARHQMARGKIGSSDDVGAVE